MTIRNMFGGSGVFHGGVMFALAADDTLYPRVDDETKSAFEDQGMAPFSYTTKSRTVRMSFWEVPAVLLDDPSEFAPWASRAHETALRSKGKG